MKAALQGKRIVVTRPAAQAVKLIALIRENGGEPLAMPLLEIGPGADSSELRRAIAALEDYALAVFVSPNAVAYSLPMIRARGPWPCSVRAAAIGSATAAALAEAGIGPVIAPLARFDSEALLELPELSGGAIAGRKVLIVRGNGGRELLAQTLRARGVRVDAVAAYRRLPAPQAQAIVSLLRNRSIDAMTISSSESLRILFAMLDTDACACLKNTATFVPHARIAAVAAELGLQKVILTGAQDAGLVEGLCKYNWLSHE